jgi:hypothetical protein
MYINENDRVNMGLEAQFIAIRIVWEGGGNKENRKMFSHRERGFPTRRGSRITAILRFFLERAAPLVWCLTNTFTKS